jgi:hypothetical protein
MMMDLDNHPDVLSWGSEEVIIPYRSPIDNRIHRYFPDFVVTMINKHGKKETKLLEIKPLSQTKPPVIAEGKKSRRYIQEVMTWGVNEAKWKAAIEFCKDRGWTFQVITERELGLKF